MFLKCLRVNVMLLDLVAYLCLNQVIRFVGTSEKREPKVDQSYIQEERVYSKCLLEPIIMLTSWLLMVSIV